MIEIIATVLGTSIVWSVFWLIEYCERRRVIVWYEKSYTENGVRYVKLPKSELYIPVRYAIYTLKNGELDFVRMDNIK
jgi:hypothetical protein